MSSLTLPRENCLEEPKTVSFGFKFVTSLDELDELFRIPLTQVERRLHKIALELADLQRYTSGRTDLPIRNLRFTLFEVAYYCLPDCRIGDDPEVW